jgi:hypothetical protein
LDRCEIYNSGLVDRLLKQTYRKLPRLPRYSTHFHIVLCFLIPFFVRMADYGPTWGPRSNDGGFQFSEVLHCYETPDVE